MNNRIKKLRKQLNLTMEKFGQKLGVRKNTVSQWENGVYIFIEKLVNSQPETQNAIVEFLKEVGSALSMDDGLMDTNTSSKTDLHKPSIYERVENFRRQLEAEEKVAEGSSALRKDA